MNTYLIKRNGELLAYLDEISWEANTDANEVIDNLDDNDLKLMSGLFLEKNDNDEYFERGEKIDGSKEEVQNYIDLTIAINKIENLLG